MENEVTRRISGPLLIYRTFNISEDRCSLDMRSNVHRLCLLTFIVAMSEPNTELASRKHVTGNNVVTVMFFKFISNNCLQLMTVMRMPKYNYEIIF